MRKPLIRWKLLSEKIPRELMCQFKVKTGSSLSLLAIWQSRTFAWKDIETFLLLFVYSLLFMVIIINPSRKGHWQYKERRERENNDLLAKCLALSSDGIISIIHHRTWNGNSGHVMNSLKILWSIRSTKRFNKLVKSLPKFCFLLLLVAFDESICIKFSDTFSSDGMFGFFLCTFCAKWDKKLKLKSCIKHSNIWSTYVSDLFTISTLPAWNKILAK